MGSLFEQDHEDASLAGNAELRALDERLEEVDEWIDKAAKNLLKFKTGSGFRRGSHSPPDEVGSTSTARSFLALHEYRRFLVEEGRRDGDADRVSEALGGLIRDWALRAETDEGLRQIRSIDQEDRPNLFTDSHLLVSLILAGNVAPDLGVGDDYSRAAPGIQRSCEQLCDLLLSEVDAAGEVGVRPGEPGHHFITFHAVRAVDAFARGDRYLNADRVRLLASVAEDRALQQLAYHSAKVMARFDPARLAFAAALLGRLKVADWRQLTQCSVEVVVGAQTDDGAWPTSQLLAYQTQSMLHVSSYELGLALACLSLRELSYGEIGVPKMLLPSLDRVMDLVRAGYVSNQDHGLGGWANDRTRWEGLVESWATAIVLTLLLRFRELVLQLRQELVLRRYDSRPPRLSVHPWADLSAALHPRRQIATKKLDEYSDPSKGGALVNALRREVLEPAVAQAGQRPEKSSIILYGDPGTRKTSLVKAAAGALSWPVVTLSPPDFLGEGGLEGFEVSAARIFEDLMRLRRAVVLFDECEDFFRPRPSDDESESNATGSQDRPETRTIGAFLTAGMLPRLQALRDQRWVIFVLATNTKLKALDKAVRRPGRFDFAEQMMHPGIEAQKLYVKGHRRRVKPEQRVAMCEALEMVAERELGWKDKRIPFAVIDHVVNTIREKDLECQTDELVELLVERLEHIDDPPSLTDESVGG